MKNFVKAKDSSSGFKYIKQFPKKLPKLSDAKIKKGIFVVP